jgi:hypothetical protein
MCGVGVSPFSWSLGGECFVQKNSLSMEPCMPLDGKFICEAGNQTFNSRADYDIHCAEVHMKHTQRQHKSGLLVFA